MTPKQVLIILRRRALTILLTLLGALVGAGLLLTLFPPRFDAQAVATVDPAQADPVTGTAAGIAGIRFLQGNMVALVKSQRVAADVVRRLGLASNPGMIARYRSSEAAGRVDIVDWIASDILRNVEARFAEGTNVLTITYKWSDGVLAAQIANTFLSAFIDAAVEMKVSGAQQTAQWFEPQMQKLRAEVEEVREKVNEYQRKARLAPITNSDAEAMLLNQLTTDLANLRAEALKIESLLNEAKRAKPGETKAQPFDSTLLQSLRASLAANIADISRSQIELGARNPKVLALEAAQRSLQTQIAAEIETARTNLETRLASINAQIAVLETARASQVDRMIDLQGQRDGMAQLALELQVKQERLNQAARAAATAQLQGQLSFSNISMLDRASPPVSPSFPKPFVVIPLAILAGLGLGVVLALIHEAMDRRIRSLHDLDYATLAPTLGQLRPSARRQRSLYQRARALAVPRRLLTG